VNKNFAIWAKEFDLVLNMGKAVTHRFHDGSHKWNYDGRSGFLYCSPLSKVKIC